mgnify:CR=1 FL=1
MTDATDAPDPTPITNADRLLSVQRIDTEADQLVNRRERLAEREQLDAASTQLGNWERNRTAMRNRLDELTVVIEQAEADAAEIREHKARLEAQMKTVIAPREAEALMHEMSTLDEQAEALDTTELAALEEQSDIDDRLTAHLSSEGALRDAVSVADGALERASVDFVETIALRCRVGETFEGTVLSHTRKGAKIQLRDPAVLAPIREQPEIGTVVSLHLDNVDSKKRRVEFSVVD